MMGVGPAPAASRADADRSRQRAEHVADDVARNRGRVTADTATLKPEQLDNVVIRFAGDSGDGM
jgi:hypothetical protein